MSRLDDEAGTRILGQKTVVRHWFLDWCCRRCQRFGAIQVQITGGGLDQNNKQLPKTTDEEFHQKLWEAHSEGNLCIEDHRFLLVGRMWRWQVDRAHGTKKQVFLELKGDDGKTTYNWPPWAGR